MHHNDSGLVKNHSIFAGRYIIEKLVGCGSHSSIFLAGDQKEEFGQVAIKLLMESASEEHFASAFINIANKFKKLNSENIVKIFDSGQYGGRLFLVMEYAHDGDLASILKRKTLSDYDTAELICDICKGIKVLRENNIVHFDIKPENIMLNGHTFQLADFGIVPPAKRRTVSLASNDVWTTISYVAPEFLDPDFNMTENDVSCDIYSLGVTAFEAFTGDNPFESSKVAISISKQINLVPPPLSDYADVNPVFSDMIAKMLAKKPEDRPLVDEVIETFQQLLEELKNAPPVFGSLRQEIHTRQAALDIEEEPEEVHADQRLSRVRHVEPFSLLRGKDSQLEATDQKTLFGKGLIKQVRSIFVAIAAVVLLSIVGYGLYRYAFSIKYKQLGGVTRLTICSECGHKQERRIIDIKQAKCSKCGKQELAYVMFCNDCSNVYPFKNKFLSKKKMTREEALRQIHRFNRCPKCKSKNSQVVFNNSELNLKLKKFNSGKKKGK